MADHKKLVYELGKFRRASRDFPDGQWCVYIKQEGEERRRFSLGIPLTEPKAHAEAQLHEWIRRRERALFDEGSKTLGEIMELYFTNRLTDGKSVEKEQRLWRANLAPVFGARKPEDINMPIIVKGEERTLAHKYAWDRSQTGIRRATIWHELNILRTGISWAAKPGRRLIDPVNVWLPRRAGSRNTHMSAEQLVKVAGECRAPHLKLFVILAICTGARKAAILQLKWDRVNMKAREIDFRLDRDQDDILDSGGMKGRSIVPIGRRLYRELEVARNWRTTDYVIEHNGKPVLDVKTALNAAMKRAGIEGKFYGAHAIRHSVATIIADRGGELRQIQKLLGHEDFGTTDKIYASHTSGYLSSAVDIVDGFLGGSEPGQKTPDDGILDEDTEHTGI
jgi:integrase